MATPTRIIHVNKSYAPEIGGVETVCQQYARLSADVFDRAEVLTISPKPGLGWYTEIVDGVRVRRCHYQFRVYGHRLSISFLLILLGLCFTRATIMTHDPFPIATMVFFLKRPHRLMVTYHADIVKQVTVKTLVDWFRGRVLQRADAITITSPTMLKSSDILPKIEPGIIHLMPIYVDDQATYSTPVATETISAKAIRALDTSTPFLLIFGRMNYYKGLDIVARAMRMLNENGRDLGTRIVIAGKIVDHEARASITELQNYSAKIEVIDDYITGSDKIYLLQQCSALLFPSSFKSEAFGIVQLEAMACGKAVINMNINSGVPWVSQDGVTGRTLELYDTEGFADLLANENGEIDQVMALSANADAELSSRFSRAKIEPALVSLFRQMQR